MGAEKIIRRASDADDVIVKAEWYMRLAQHLKKQILRPSLPSYTLDEVMRLNLDQEPEEDPLSKIKRNSVRGWKERLALYFHDKRPIVPGAAQRINEAVAEGAEWYILSGRREKRPWEQMSENQFIIRGKLPVKDIKLARLGIPTAVCKAFWIDKLGIDEYDDDDGLTIRYLAGLFPNKKFNHINHGLAPLSETTLKDNSNIDVIPFSEWVGIVQPQGDSLTRNSSLRNSFAIKNKIGEILAKAGIDPNWITEAGGLAALASVVELTRQNLDGKSHFYKVLRGGGGIAAALILDSIDGATADAKNKIEPGSHDTQFGGALDASIDKGVSVAMSASKMVTAYKREDWYGLVVAAVSGITHPLSALYRAEGEARGEKFAESKSFFKDPLYFGGTQLGRNLFGISSTIWPNAHRRIFCRTIYWQHVTDTYSAISNIYVAARRSRGGQEIVPSPMPEKPEDYKKWQEKCDETEKQKAKIMEEGAYRARWMSVVVKASPVVIGGVGLGLLVYHALTKRK